jgi:hypothetical protein
MERDVMDIVKEKEFIELSAADRAELGELCSSEEEFNQVKAMFAGIGAMDWSNPTPKDETKESLDHLFAQKYPKAAPVWYNAPLAVLTPTGKPFYRQPLVQAAAVGLLIFLAYPFVNSNVMTSDTTQVAALDEENTSSEGKEMETQEKERLDESKETNLSEQESASTETRKVNLTPNEVIAPVPSQPVPADPVTSIDLMSATTTMTAAFSVSEVEVASGVVAFQPGSSHPDGVFIGDKTEIFSAPASSEPAVFDLLTSTF